jgi:hypothetical protein
MTAFLNSNVEEEMHIQVPQSLEGPEEFKKGSPGFRLLKVLNQYEASSRTLKR